MNKFCIQLLQNNHFLAILRNHIRENECKTCLDDSNDIINTKPLEDINNYKKSSLYKGRKMMRDILIVNMERKIKELMPIPQEYILPYIRGFHLCSPILFMILFMYGPKYVAMFIVIFLLGSACLFYLLGGCFLSMIENRFADDTYYLADTVLLLMREPINRTTRMNLTLFVGLVYAVTMITFVVLRFNYNYTWHIISFKQVFDWILCRNDPYIPSLEEYISIV